ncbi:polysaccharide pyruvyl transferase family protein [uncultured Dokdonia sp.]|uniref:polysaccharide pyruvyl transferase family protein n=1 Tax=uncultured Dokdonia sp. TaxID=575653 RepID=UPI002627F5C9|nr:polysaccharide pyruvyl transferase family protein [uncultured Dokdonia sp.]
MRQEIPLFYWSSKIFENKNQENYGDILSAQIVSWVSGKETSFYNAPQKKKSWFKKSYLMAIGSIMSYTQPKATVWGSGIISRKDQFSNATFCAVRGPLSRKRILELGYTCPEIYGDPAILLPDFYQPTIEKKYEYGFIPHYVDQDIVSEWYNDKDKVTVLNLINDDIFFITDRMLECKKIISSSLHGVIVAQTYGIPAIWVQFSNKLSGDNVKYADYFLSVGITPYTPVFIDEKKPLDAYEAIFSEVDAVPDAKKIKEVRTALKNAFPKEFL